MEWEEVSRALTFPAHSNFLAMANGERERARAAEKRASICKKFMDLDQHTGQHRDSQDLTILKILIHLAWIIHWDHRMSIKRQKNKCCMRLSLAALNGRRPGRLFQVPTERHPRFAPPRESFQMRPICSSVSAPCG